MHPRPQEGPEGAMTRCCSLCEAWGSLGAVGQRHAWLWGLFPPQAPWAGYWHLCSFCAHIIGGDTQGRGCRAGAQHS